MSRLVAHGRPWALPLLLFVTVVCFAAGAGSVPEIVRVGWKLRWIALFATGGLAVLEAALAVRGGRRVPRGLRPMGIVTGLFLSLAFLSTAWSVDPTLTFERAASVGVMFVMTAALAVVVGDDPAARRRMVVGLAGGAVLVTVAGVVLALAGSDYAIQRATSQTSWRLRGLLENPNTVGVMTAVAMPLLAWLALTAGERRVQAAWWAALAVLLGAAVASQSRGGLAAAVVGVSVVLVVLVERWPRRVAAVAAFGAVIAGGIVLRQVAQPAPPPFYSAVEPGQQPGTTTVPRGSGTSKPGSGTGTGTSPGKGKGSGSHGKPGSGKGGSSRPPVKPVRPGYVELPARKDEIGHPVLSTASVSTAGSGRVAAWKGTLKTVRDRPLLGYGFGTESEVFVDRWYYFDGGTPENSSLGLLLQLGVAGLGVLVALVGLLAFGGVRLVRRSVGEVHSFAGAGLGVLASAVVLTAIQSYVYSVGNVATLTVWSTLFLLGAVALGKGSSAQSA